MKLNRQEKLAIEMVLNQAYQRKESAREWVESAKKLLPTEQEAIEMKKTFEGQENFNEIQENYKNAVGEENISREAWKEVVKLVNALGFNVSYYTYSGFRQMVEIDAYPF